MATVGGGPLLVRCANRSEYRVPKVVVARGRDVEGVLSRRGGPSPGEGAGAVAEVRDCERLLRDVSATLERWQRVLATALRFATDCAATYRRADERTRARYNAEVFERLIVSGGQIVDAEYAEPFGGVFALPELEYEDLVPATGLEPVTKGLRV